MESVVLRGLEKRFSGRDGEGRWNSPGRRWSEESELRCKESNQMTTEDTEWWPPEDTSHAGFWLRYTSFVVGLAAAVSATLFILPVVLLGRMNACQPGCFSLDVDLRRSMDSGVHPCDDFYRHVCHGWDVTRNPYPAPLDKYRNAFSRRIVKDMLLQTIPLYTSKSKEKAAGFMFRCLSRGELRDNYRFTAFLQDIRLPWPGKSRVTRAQILNTLVRSSLHFGMPMFWAFYVGRHPRRPSENTIYMRLDPRSTQWIRNIEALHSRRKEVDYLRRCAEIVGTKGQSYSTMIRNVLITHDDIAKLIHTLGGNDVLPRFNNLSDPDLRRAINGHLPDDSQLWPTDEIVNLHYDLFTELDYGYFSRIGYVENFQLFLGAYVVWALSPMVSTYLTDSLLEDMGLLERKKYHSFLNCLDALDRVMPLVKWQLHRDSQKDLAPTWDILRLSKLSVSKLVRRYSESSEAKVKVITERIVANAFNMSKSWPMLDHAYAYLPNDTNAQIFDLYQRFSMATVRFFKKSLLRPRHSIYHVPGIASVEWYNLLIGRQVTVDPYLVSPPVYDSTHPTTVLSALSGVPVAKALLELVRIALYYNSRYEVVPFRDTDPGARKQREDYLRFEAVLKVSNLLTDVSLSEVRDVFLESMAAHTASYIPQLQSPDVPDAGGDDTARLKNGNGLLWGFPRKQLFFYLRCFSQCGATGRNLQRKDGKDDFIKSVDAEARLITVNGKDPLAEDIFGIMVVVLYEIKEYEEIALQATAKKSQLVIMHIDNY